MNIKIAAKETQKLVLEAPSWPTGYHVKQNGLSRFHVAGLLTAVIDGKVKGEKAHRWLGWSQAALVMTGNATLDDMKDVNHRA